MTEVRGVSIVAGKAAQGTGESFTGFDPVKGKPLSQQYCSATNDDIDRACAAAWEAFVSLDKSARTKIPTALDGIADRLTDLGKALVSLVSAETGLSTTRVISERERTCGVLRMFAQLVRDGEWVRACIEPGDAMRRPNPKPDLRRMLRPLGPVAVFGVSNFPLAYSTAGGDTASALAAGCPVVVKGHPMHPGTGELVAAAVAEAVAAAGLPGGMFSFLHAGGPREREVGQRLVTDPRIRAVGFTGSVAGGTAIDRMARSRDEPIPVFAEMGSVNPVFLLPDALERKGTEIAERIVGSVTNAMGQMCTCPSLLFVMRGPHADEFERALATKFDASEQGPMLGPKILEGFVSGIDRMRGVEGVEVRGGSVTSAKAGSPAVASAALLRTTGAVFQREESLREEVFGPSTMLVVCADEAEFLACARSLRGNLTGTVFVGSYDGALLGVVQPILERRVGRLVFNGVPTGVEVNAAMVHGGPFPATTASNSTAQGALAIERWCRPVSYQNAPEAALPEELRDSNPLGILREIAGVSTRSAVGSVETMA